MNPQLQQQLKAQLEGVKDAYQGLLNKAGYDDLSDLGGRDLLRVAALARAAILRVAGPNSSYAQQVEQILSRTHPDRCDGYKVTELAGVAEALFIDLDSGHLQSLEELIHGDLFGDFLEMSSHLLDKGYKDAGAVITGSTLEAHLRQLCQRNGIDIESTTTGIPRTKKAGQMNADLVKANIYSKIDQKNVTAWLGLRNKAAHAHYGEYTTDQVRLMTDSVRDFITRNPA